MLRYTAPAGGKSFKVQGGRVLALYGACTLPASGFGDSCDKIIPFSQGSCADT